MLLMPGAKADGEVMMDTCCYGSRTIPNGGLIRSFPTKCMQLFCLDGYIEERYYNTPEDCLCCEYNGRMYQNGEQMAGICIDMTCVDGGWVTNGCFDDCCKKCNVQNDPHITTFDNYYYHWHGTCNYSISQIGYGYDEDFGIYGQFQQCNSAASCIGQTTFKDNPTTAIDISFNSGANVMVNGDNYVVKNFVEVVDTGNGAHPVLAWRDGSCNMFLGSQGYLLITCPSQVSVWAYPNLIEEINGLCGHFNMYQADDFMDRMNVQQPLVPYPFGFPMSWETADQPSCNTGISARNGMDEPTEDPCPLDDVMRLKAECQALLEDVKWHCVPSSETNLENSISSCASDLCAMEQSGATQDAIDDWKKEMKMMLKLNVKIEVKTENGDACKAGKYDDSEDSEHCEHSENSETSESSEHSLCNEDGNCNHAIKFSAKQIINLEFGGGHGHGHKLGIEDDNENDSENDNEDDSEDD